MDARMVIASGSVLGSVLLPVMHETYSMCLSMQWKWQSVLVFLFFSVPFLFAHSCTSSALEKCFGEFLEFLGPGVGGAESYCSGEN